MKEIYKGVFEIKKNEIKSIQKENIEKDLIISFLKNIPLEKLKELVSLNETDFEDEKQWHNAWGYDSEIEELHRLRIKNITKYQCEISI